MSEAAPKFHQVELRELQPLLRKKLADDDLVLVDFAAESLLPSGENYGSTILKVRATVRRADGKPESLDLVAKMLPPTDFQRKMFDSPYTFRKEAFLYEELIPSYRQLEREFGVAEEETFDIVPEFYGARYSLKDDESFDDDAVLLMQNIKVLGYYTGNRREGLDYEHARLAIAALARFHALGIAMREHKPEYFEYLKSRSKALQLSEEHDFEEPIRMIVDIVKSDPEIAAHADFVAAAMSRARDPKNWWTIPPEPWPTIIHSDFWVNNIMFHRDPLSNRVDDVKFVDFQNYLLLSPLRELVFFLVVSTNAETITERFDELLTAYHDEFVRVLGRMRVDTAPFARRNFDARLKIDAFAEFSHCPLMLNILTMEVKEDEKFDNPDKFLTKDSFGERFKQRLRLCVKKYVEKGWDKEVI